jgi:hypothetical protein
MKAPAIRPSRHRLVLLLALLAGCAGAEGGGPIGTGITSSVAGNVVAVVDDGGASEAAALAVPAVAVSIDEAPGVATITDADGNFTLEGDFSGP